MLGNRGSFFIPGRRARADPVKFSERVAAQLAERRRAMDAAKAKALAKLTDEELAAEIRRRAGAP